MKNKDLKTQVNNLPLHIESLISGEQFPNTDVQSIQSDTREVDFTDQIHEAVCHADLPQHKDQFIRGFYGKVSLGEAITKLRQFKNAMKEEIKANITTYLPDMTRPAKLALDVKRQVDKYREIISCVNGIITRVTQEMAEYLNEITNFIAEIDVAIGTLMIDFQFLVNEVAALPADTLNAIADGMLEIAQESGMIAVLQSVDAFSDELDYMQQNLDAFSSLLPDFANYTEDQIRATLNTIQDYPDELAYLFESLDDYAIDQIRTVIEGYMSAVDYEIQTGWTVIENFETNMGDEYAYLKDTYEGLSEAKESAELVYNKYETQMAPPSESDDTQELLDYEEEIMGQIGGGGGGGVIGGEGTYAMIVDSFIMDQEKSYNTISDQPVVRPDQSHRVLYTSETGLDASLRYEYDEYHEDLYDLSQGEVTLVDISGGPGVIFPDGSSRFTGLLRISMHTSEAQFFYVTIKIFVDDELRNQYTVRGYGLVGMVFEDEQNPGNYVNKQFQRDLQINTLKNASGDMYPIMFKDNFKITIEKSNREYAFSNTFIVEAGVRYLLLSKEEL